MRTRRPTRLHGLPLAVAVAAACVAANAVAVAMVEPLSLQNLGPLALVYHDREPSPVLVPILVALVLLGRRTPASVRVPLLLFVGAAAGNLLSSVVWSEGVPDYLVVAPLGVVTNVPDVVIAGALCSAVVGMAHDLTRRRAPTSEAEPVAVQARERRRS